ncbi:MAG: LamG domain-containing protein, partial [Chloroflexia bacterium]|nr:LamG domain-containing protein [Chloroflexia bacterium]
MTEINDFSVKLEQIRDRVFTKDVDLTETVLKHIDLTLEDKYKEDIEDLASDYEEIADHMGAVGTSQKFFLFSEDKRDSLKAEYYLYLSHILDKSVEIDSNKIGKINLGEATIRREIPVASVSPAVIYNVPDDNKAYFTAQFGNNSASGDAMWYKARVLEETNPDGAVLLIDGEDVNRTYEIKAGEFINKTISVEMGKPDVYDYENLQIALYSPCEWDFHTNGMAMPAEAIDTVTFSVHFVPSCTDVDVVMPNEMFVVNSRDENLVEGVKETKVPIMMSGYDLNNNIFEKVTFQYKFSAEPEWTSTTPFYVNPADDEQEIPGAFTALEWNLSGYPDGQYMMRAKTGCGTSPEGTEIFDLSEVWTGTVDRKPPKVFGSPQPADGILSPDDDIIIEFNETIFGGKLSKIENFDIRGILNGTEIRHDVSVKFDDDANMFVRIPDGINLSDKSFTVEFWMKPARAMYKECLFAQSTNPKDAICIGLTNSGTLEMQVANQTVEFESYSVTDYLESWNHYAFIFDNVRKEAILMIDGIPQISEPINAAYGAFGDTYIGKSMFGNGNPFKGNIHELRIWERARTAGKIYENMLITLSGKETALLGYWPLDDADGTLAAEKVHKRNATVTGLWEILPAGYACSLTGNADGLINVPFSDVAFTPEQDFTIEMWFKGLGGANQCLLSNGHGDQNDVTLYYISMESLDKIVRVMPLEDSIDILLAPMLNRIFSDQVGFINEVGLYIGSDRALQYEEQILRFA